MALTNVRSADDAAAVAARIISELQDPMRLAQHTMVVTPSVGVAMFPDDGVDAEILLRPSQKRRDRS